MKRVLSLLLTVTMLIGLMPNISLVTASAASTDTLVYNFTVSAISDESIINTDAKGNKSVEVGKVTSSSQLDASVSTGAWTYVERPGLYSTANLMGSYLQYSATSKANAVLGKNALALKIAVAENGTYIPTFKHVPQSISTVHFNVFMVSQTGKTARLNGS